MTNSPATDRVSARCVAAGISVSDAATRSPPRQQEAILAVSSDRKALEAMPVHDYVDMYVI